MPLIKEIRFLILAIFFVSCAEQKAFTFAETQYSCECNTLTLVNDSLFKQNYQAKLICFVNLRSKPKSANDSLKISSVEPSVLLLYKNDDKKKIRIFGDEISHYINYNELGIQNCKWKISYYISSFVPKRFQYGFSIQFLPKDVVNKESL